MGFVISHVKMVSVCLWYVSLVCQNASNLNRKLDIMYIYIYIWSLLIEHVHHQLFHIHTCADISFAADTIAAFLSRAQTWAPKPRLGHPAEKTSTSSSLVKRGERSCGDWLEGIEDKNRREIRRKRIGSGEKPGEDPAGPHQVMSPRGSTNSQKSQTWCMAEEKPAEKN